MDILSFVNSKDIRDYLHEIDYKCDSMQAAWLVYQNTYKTYEEKHEAWNWIIENMPDCEMPKRRFSIARPSLHGYLKELMEYRDRYKNRIKKGKYPKPCKKMTDEEWDLYEHAFESRWYCFPTPFKEGILFTIVMISLITMTVYAGGRSYLRASQILKET